MIELQGSESELSQLKRGRVSGPLLKWAVGEIESLTEQKKDLELELLLIKARLTDFKNGHLAAQDLLDLQDDI